MCMVSSLFTIDAIAIATFLVIFGFYMTVLICDQSEDYFAHSIVM